MKLINSMKRDLRNFLKILEDCCEQEKLIEELSFALDCLCEDIQSDLSQLYSKNIKML